MDRRRFLVAGASALGACVRRTAPPGVNVRIAVGGSAQIVYLPTTLAERLGHFREEGLNVALQDFPGGSKALQALLGGSADVVSGFYDHTIQMAAKPGAEARKLTAFVNMLRFPGLSLVVSPKAAKKIERIDDLAGTRAGVTAPGSSTHFFLNYLLAKRSVPLEEVSVTGIGHSAAALAAVENGQVDVAVMTDPALAELQARRPKLLILADTRTPEGVRDAFGTSEYPASVLYASTDWLRANTDTAKRLARAMRRTLTWMIGHTADAIANRMPEEHQGSDPLLYRQALLASMPIFNPSGAITMEGAEAVKRVLSYSVPEVRDAAIDLKSTFTNEFVEAE